MSERSSRYIPIEEAQTETMRFAVGLPEFVDKDNIGVNTRAVERLCRIGGIRRVSVVSDSKGERSGYVPNVVGVDNHGQGIAGKAGISRKVPTYTADSEIDGDGRYLPHAARWVETTIFVNNNEVEQRIMDNPKWKDGVRSTKAWANHLNRAVKEGIVESGFKHLTMGLSRLEWKSTAMQYSIMGAFEAFDPSVQSAVSRVIITSSVLNMFNLVRVGFSKDFRFSITYGPQVDRALALQLVGAGSTLVKDVPQEVSE